MRYLGYADWQALAQTIALGYPSSSQPLFLVRDAFNRLTPSGEESTRFALCQLDAIDRQRADARARLKARKIGTIELNAGEIGALMQEYVFWRARLADSLGVAPNPYSELEYGVGLGGINGRVIG